MSRCNPGAQFGPARHSPRRAHTSNEYVKKTKEKSMTFDCRASRPSICMGEGTSGIPGSEYADYKAREAAYRGSLMNQRQTCTPAGIRQQFHTNRLTKQVKTWNRNALKGLTCVVTDVRHRQGPLKSWLHKIQRQNAAHILQCREVGDGKDKRRGMNGARQCMTC